MNDRPALPAQLRSVEAVLSELSAGGAATRPAWRNLDEAIGQVLARDITVPAPVPLRTMALIDGYAVESASLVGASPYAPCLLGTGLAGTIPVPVGTGAELPGSADAVLPADAVLRRAGLFEVSLALRPGENARRVGEDAGAGQILASAGTVLRPLVAAAAAAAGLDRVCVKAVRLSVVAEDDFHRPAMRILAGLDGARIDGVRGTGLPAAREIPMGDAIVYFGHDRSRFEAVLPTGVPVATGLALRGAETTMVGLSEGRLVVWAPPRFDTLLALRYALLQPWVDARCGLRRRPVWRCAPLLRKLASVVGLAELALLCEAPGGLEPLGLGSLTLAGIAQAEGYLIVPPGSEGAQAGQTVEAFAL